MKKISLFTALLLLVSSELFAQVTINSDGSLPDNSAMFDVKSTNKGVLLPRITKSQRNAIVSPANGLMVFCTNCGTAGSLSIFTNGSWLTFSPCTVASPVAGSHLMSQGQITWNWNVVPGATGYKWSTTPDYETATDMGTALSKTETGTVCNITYTRYIWAYNGCGDSGMTTLTQTISPVPPASPTAGINIVSLPIIVWNWNTVAGATGYKWNTTDDYASAIDMGTATTITEAGFICGMTVTRYVWAYNTCGNSTALTMIQTTTSSSFTCGQTFTDTRDCKIYNTVLIGTQCWLAQNLNIGTRINASGDQTNNNTIEKYCYYDAESMCDVYGGLYQWAEMVQYLNGATNTSSWNPVPTGNITGICPAGWHIGDWGTVVTFLGGYEEAGGKMKSTGTLQAGTGLWQSPNTGATNESGFTGLPAGIFDGGYSNFGAVGYNGHWWLSWEGFSTSDAWSLNLDYYKSSVGEYQWPKVSGLSVRCLRD
jgi:uncharacterized protein (TIGR02145 family)